MRLRDRPTPFKNTSFDNTLQIYSKLTDFPYVPEATARQFGQIERLKLREQTKMLKRLYPLDV